VQEGGFKGLFIRINALLWTAFLSIIPTPGVLGIMLKYPKCSVCKKQLLNRKAFYFVKGERELNFCSWGCFEVFKKKKYEKEEEMQSL